MRARASVIYCIVAFNINMCLLVFFMDRVTRSSIEFAAIVWGMTLVWSLAREIDLLRKQKE